MDQGQVLQLIYKGITKENFDYGSFSKRLELQKIIYLLQEKGLNVGGYSFSWYKHGPYSQSLQEDAYRSTPASINLQFTDDARSIIDYIAQLLVEVKPEKYTRSYFMEAVASMRYMLKNGLCNEAEVIEELKNRKEHLDNENDNKLAMETVKIMFS